MTADRPPQLQGSLARALTQAKDVPQLTIDVGTPRPWDMTDSELVAALQRVGGRAFVALKAPGEPGSTWGNHVDLVAPWQVFTTTFPVTVLYGTFCGTSYATAAVSGVALLLRARYPSWANWEVRARLEATAFPLGPPGWDDHFGHGLIRGHLAAAFDPPNITASVVSGKPKLTWSAVPFATGYDIFRAVTPTACPGWALWATTTTISYTDFSTAVSSFYGYDVTPSQTAVQYYVVAKVLEGNVTTFSTAGRYATFLPNFDPPSC